MSRPDPSSPSAPKRMILDSMIFDRIVADEAVVALVEALTVKGTLEILTTYVQENELLQITDAAKAAAIGRVRRQPIPTGAFVLGHSPLGMARLGPAGPIEAVRGDGTNHSADALIAATARWEHVDLVTEDKRLGRRAATVGVTVRTFDDFRHELEQMAAD